MIHLGLAGLMLAAGANGGTSDRIELAQFTVRERIIVRVPTQTPPGGRPDRPSPPPIIKWKEKSAPDCVPMTGVAGAALMNPTTVDFILQGGMRIRAQLTSSCPALGFYNGFYLLPTSDGKVCVGRDTIHARSGGECQIKRFKRLVPAH